MTTAITDEQAVLSERLLKRLEDYYRLKRETQEARSEVDALSIRLRHAGLEVPA